MAIFELLPSARRFGTILGEYDSQDMKKVLVIDDSEETRLTISELLNSAGYVTIDAPDGVLGFQLARDSHPDLILCDIQMPQIDGYETRRVLRKNEFTAGIPFIFVSGFARDGSKMGADDYLPKPFTVSELIGTVTKKLETRQ